MSPTPRLRTGLQIAYASADLGLNATEAILRLYLLIFYTDVVGLRPGLAGLAVALGLVWDAVTDPVMGAISDRLRHRLGGRRFFVLIGGGLLATGLILVFSPPLLEGQGARFTWLLGSYVFLNLGLTVLAIPHTAMSSELTEDPHDRSVLFGWRFAFANVGAVLAAALPVALDSGDSDGTGGIGALGPVCWVTGVLIVLGSTIAWAATGRVRRPAPVPSTPFRLRALLLPLQNPAFRPLVAAYFVATVGIGVNGAVALYYYGHYLALTDRQIQILLVVFMTVFTTSLAGWVRASRTFGKQRPLTVGAVILGVGTSVMYPVLPPGNFALPLVLGAIGLGSLVGCILLIDSLLTDVIDHDRLRTRSQNAGVYFGIWRFAAKLARAAALLSTGLVLELVGFDPKDASRAGAHPAIAWSFGPGVGVFFVAAGLILARYRFDDAQQARVRRLLARREARRSADDGLPR